MTEEAKAKRRQLDHERYMAKREERIAGQRAYYRSNREAILTAKRKSGFLKYGTLR